MVQQTATTPTNLRSDLYKVLDKVTTENQQVTITMKTGKNAVLLSEDEHNRLLAAQEELQYHKELKQLEAELAQAMDDIKNGRTYAWDEVFPKVAENSPEYRVDLHD